MNEAQRNKYQAALDVDTVRVKLIRFIERTRDTPRLVAIYHTLFAPSQASRRLQNAQSGTKPSTTDNKNRKNTKSLPEGTKVRDTSTSRRA